MTTEGGQVSIPVRPRRRSSANLDPTSRSLVSAASIALVSNPIPDPATMGFQSSSNAPMRQPNYVNPPTRGPAVQVTSILFAVLVTLSLILRLYTRGRIKRRLEVDDIFAAFATVCALIFPFCARSFPSPLACLRLTTDGYFRSCPTQRSSCKSFLS